MSLASCPIKGGASCPSGELEKELHWRISACPVLSLESLHLQGASFSSAPSGRKLFRASLHSERSVGSRVVTEQAGESG